MLVSIFIGSIIVKKGLLLLMGTNLLPDDKDDTIDDFINNDNLKTTPEKSPNKAHLFSELERLKQKLREDLNDTCVLTDKYGIQLTLRQIIKQFEANKNRIGNVRLLIEQELQITKNFHKPTGITYIIVRKNWIDKTGKKVRKFTKNLGDENKVYIKGKIPLSLLIQAEQELDQKMWEQYQSDYPE